MLPNAYRANVRAEQEGSLLYQERANSVQDANLVELYRRLSDAEQRHASIWAKRLQAAGQPIPTYTLGLRMRMLVWMAKRFGVSSVLPMISRRERGASRDYEAQPEARQLLYPLMNVHMHASFERSNYPLGQVLPDLYWHVLRDVIAVPVVGMHCERRY